MKSTPKTTNLEPFKNKRYFVDFGMGFINNGNLRFVSGVQASRSSTIQRNIDEEQKSFHQKLGVFSITLGEEFFRILFSRNMMHLRTISKYGAV